MEAGIENDCGSNIRKEAERQGLISFRQYSTWCPKMVLHPEAGVSFGVGIVAAVADVAVANDRKRIQYCK